MLETAANDHNPGVTFDQAPKDVPFHEIVIVGGGAAGLELATGLGNTLARRRRARITLVDKARASLEAASTFRGGGQPRFRRACARLPCPSTLA